LKISLFVPCYIDQLFPEVAISTVRLFEKLGHQVAFPPSQTCCGQPSFNAGYAKEAKELASRFLDVFQDAEVIVAPSGSCVAMIKRFYRGLFTEPADLELVKQVESKTFELTEFLVQKLEVIDVGASFPGKVTWHDGCHGLRELGLKTEGRQLLSQVKGLELIQMKDSDTCCGFGGTFSVKFPSISTAMSDVKISSIEQSGADWVASGDSSCLMQIGGFLKKQNSRIKTIHIAQILVS
jgi:L-lactate dehydrogenase complex protein LldE